MSRYRTLRTINATGEYVTAGKLVDLPEDVVQVLLDDGAIEEVTDGEEATPETETPAPEAPADNAPLVPEVTEAEITPPAEPAPEATTQPTAEEIDRTLESFNAPPTPSDAPPTK